MDGAHEPGQKTPHVPGICQRRAPEPRERPTEEALDCLVRQAVPGFVAERVDAAHVVEEHEQLLPTEGIEPQHRAGIVDIPAGRTPLEPRAQCGDRE